MKQRIIILLLFVGTFLTGLALIPETPAMKPSRLSRRLPESFERWQGSPQEPSLEEKQKLAGDTDFERMSYRDTSGTLPAVEASIVFSGKSLSQSIHRPEVCFRAQGWKFESETYLVLEGVMPDGGDLPVKEIICSRIWTRENEEGKQEPIVLSNGETAQIWRAFYYTFFGHEAIVPGHYQRTVEDIKDRLFKGHDQRWAYATFASFINSKHAEQGLPIGNVTVLDEVGTKAHIAAFLKELLPLVLSEPGEGYDPSLVGGNKL
ncbi:MAG: exosortase-associated EpsI family protein [Verrucomicrobiaceae bacterium]